MDSKALESFMIPEDSIATEGISNPNDQIKNNIPIIKSIISKFIEQIKEKYKNLQFNCVIKPINNGLSFDVFRDKSVLNENNEKYKEANRCINSIKRKIEGLEYHNPKLKVEGYFLCLVEDMNNENRIAICYEK